MYSLFNDIPNKYPNIFGGHIFTKQISKYIHTRKMAGTQIIIKGYSIQIFEYSFTYRRNYGKRLTHAVLKPILNAEYLLDA